MKILLFGKGGQVGWELQRSLALLGEVVALDHDSADFCGDFTRLSDLAHSVRTIRPDVVVNAAAHTAVDKAESERDTVHTINAEAPGVLAQEAEALGAWLVHYSTDYVFDGSGQHPWSEEDLPKPLNTYGQTKWLGEQNIAQACANHLILRTSWVYAARGGNFAKTMLRLAKDREELTVINDQIGAPTGAELLADATALALRHLIKQPSDAGTYHLTASGETSWHGYAQHVLATARSAGVDLKAQNVKAVPSSAFPTPAKRPQNSRLNTQKFQSTFGLRLPPWELGVDRMLAEIL